MILHDFADVLSYLSPPLCVVKRLAAQRASLCPDATNFLDRWHALRTGEPLTELDDWLGLAYGSAPGPGPSHDTAQGASAEGRLPWAVGEADTPACPAASPLAHRPGGKGAGLLSQQEPLAAESSEEGGRL